MNYLIITLSILPIVLIAIYYYKKDTLKEPKKLLRKLFFSGMLSGVLVIIISYITILFFPTYASIENANMFKIFIYSFVFVALIEEVCKWLMIYKISYHHRDFDQLYDIILYSVLVGLGFACLENLLYTTSSNNIWVAVFRGITAIPAHACFQTFMGYYLTLAKFKKGNQNKYKNLSLIIPVLLHGTYDFLLLSGNIVLVCSFFIFIVFLFIITIIKVKKIINIDKNNLNLDNNK